MFIHETEFMTEFIEIDGSQGEGGGQMIRTSVALSAITGKPIKITNIRAKRCNPGLRPQHLKGIEACASMCSAELTGGEIGSNEITFIPGKISSGNHIIDTGTAGSVVLILQTILLPALHADAPVKLEIIGGTEGLWAPSIEYFNEVLAKFLEKMNIDINVEIVKHGFYPKGGGKVLVNINPCKEIKPLNLTERGKFTRTDIRAGVSEGLRDKQVAERMINGAKKIFEKFDCEHPIYLTTNCLGGYVHMHAHYENTILGSTSIANKGIRAEDLGESCAKILKEDMKSNACLDRYMADQILPFLALAGGSISVAQISNHTKTNMHIIEKFLPVKFEVDEKNKIISVKKLKNNF